MPFPTPARTLHRTGFAFFDRLDTAEAGLVRLRRENRVLRMERDLLIRAAAFFAQENVLPPRQ